MPLLCLSISGWPTSIWTSEANSTQRNSSTGRFATQSICALPLSRGCERNTSMSKFTSIVILQIFIKLICVGTVTEDNLDAAKTSAAGKVLVSLLHRILSSLVMISKSANY